ncbi:MAG: SEC-C metal-binding domain-containing protein, partial [Nitrospinota bacterium]
TERHESRRIDNQLRGRAGRQGDPGSSRFYLSLEDDLLRIFGSDRIKGIMEKLGMEEGVPIEARMVTRAIENAQKRVEAHHFEMRKHLLEYDDVLNKQREVIYTLRRQILEGSDIGERIQDMAGALLDGLIGLHMPEGEHFEEWDLASFLAGFERQFGIPGGAEGYTLRFASPACALDVEEEPREAVAERLHGLIREAFQAKYAHVGESVVRDLERIICIQVLDAQWKDHLTGIEHLKEGIGLRGYAQVNPLNEYKKEAFALFEALNDRIDSETIQYLYRLDVSGERVQVEEREQPKQELVYSHASAGGFGGGGANGAPAEPVRRKSPKVGRNDPCPCGSGKKYKHCHGR